MTALDISMLIGLCLVFYWQYKRTGVFFLPSSVLLLINIILAIYVAYPLATSPESLSTIGQTRHFRTIQWGADEVLGIATIGVVCALMAYVAAGLLGTRLVRVFARSASAPRSISMNEAVMAACLTVFLAQGYVFYTFYRAGSLPLFSSDPLYWRFALAKNLGGSLYLGALTVSGIAITFLLAAIALRKVRSYRLLGLIAIGLTCFTSLSTATRSAFLGPFVSAGLIYFSAKEKKLTFPRTLAICAGLLVLAAGLQAIRYKSAFSWGETEDEILYGDTFFANFRDTSWTIAYFEADRYDFVHGKTILAGLLGFLPHDESSFRSQYRWGTFALHVVGNDDPSTHAGLAHVLFADWYVNFGYMGVVIEGLILGLVLRFFDERLLYIRNSAKNLKQFDCYAAFKTWSWCGVATALMSSAGAPFAYPQIAGLLAIGGFAAAFHKISQGLRAVVHLPPRSVPLPLMDAQIPSARTAPSHPGRSHP